MERRRPRNKQQAQCGTDRARRARRLRAATPRLPNPARGQRDGADGVRGGNAGAANAPAAKVAARLPESPLPDKPLPENPVPQSSTMRCAFGATRAGALLGRVRLHLQTERFLAVRRDDAIWEAGCLLASIALGNLVAELSEDEMKIPLSGQAQRAALASVASGAIASGADRPVAPGGAHRSDPPAAAAPGATAQSEGAR